ncbi:hypothetical protein [Schlesneria sp. T3-172]|uniref:hypothetical protein n=1 Tax=Schlesneria sphaerica TaxID=3373610 RepID=UPI0037CAAE72
MASTSTRPSWYTDEDDTAWSKVKAAFQRDWTQTKHDFGADEPDLNQEVGDTVGQATGNQPIPPGNTKTRPDSENDIYSDDDESAYRYGYAASRHFDGDEEWDDELEENLRSEWRDESDWECSRNAVRRGWCYGKQQGRINQPR